MEGVFKIVVEIRGCGLFLCSKSKNSGKEWGGGGGGLCEILSVVGVRIDVFSGTTNCNENVGKSQKVKKKKKNSMKMLTNKVKIPKY